MLRVRNATIAEDLVQETLVKAFQNFGKFRFESTVKTWLTRILRNEISTHFRKSKLQSEKYKDVADAAPTMGQLLYSKLEVSEFKSAVERDEFWSVIRECFDKVPEHLLETFLLRLTNENESIEDLCKDLEINPSNFSVRLFRTRLLLRKCVERKWLAD